MPAYLSARVHVTDPKRAGAATGQFILVDGYAG